MREVPACSRSASTMTRAPSCSVIACVFSFAPSAMPTRSAPSSRAFCLTSLAVSGFLKIFIFFPELLQLARDDPFVAGFTDPADVPLGQSGQRLAFLARALELRRLGDFLRRLLRDLLLDVGEVRVVVVAHRAHREAARAVAERADHAQEALPETEQVARLDGLLLFLRGKRDEFLHEVGDRHVAELLRLGGARRLVEAPLPHGVRRAGVQAAAARLADA